MAGLEIASPVPPEMDHYNVVPTAFVSGFVAFLKEDERIRQ